ncbi:MAG: MarR family transcriptional regulator [Herminiimonas sp.]|nr:MarR family transcriptional regulator [Herminiimonas sp.]
MRVASARGSVQAVALPAAANTAAADSAAAGSAVHTTSADLERDSNTIHPMPHVPGVDYGLLDNLVGYGIRRAQLAIYDDFIRSLAQWDITPPRFSALVIIGNNPGLKLTDLANVLAVARSGAVILADTLEARGLIERRDSATDRRAWGLHLTRAGRSLLEKTTHAVREQDERVSATLTAEERATLLGLLRKVARLDRQD